MNARSRWAVVMVAGLALGAEPPTPVATLDLPGLPERDKQRPHCWVGFSPVGRHLVAWYNADGLCRLVRWDARRPGNAETIKAVEACEPAADWRAPVAFDAGGKRLYSLAAGKVFSRSLDPLDPDERQCGMYAADPTLWPGRAGEFTVVSADHMPATIRVACFCDGDTLARVGQVERDLEREVSVRAAAVSSDGQTLAYGERESIPDIRGEKRYRFHLIDLREKRPAVGIGLECPAYCSRFSPDGRTVAAGLDDGRVQLIDVPTGTAGRATPGGDFTVSCVAFSSDGTYLAFGSYDTKGKPNVYVARVADGQVVRAWSVVSDGKGAVSGVAFNAAGDRLAVAQIGGPVLVYDTKDILPR